MGLISTSERQKSPKQILKRSFTVVFFSMTQLNGILKSDTHNHMLLVLFVGSDTDVSCPFASLAAVLWFSVFVVDVFKDVSLTIHQQWLSCHTSDPHWPYGVLVESEALFQSMSSHVFIEDITSSEIQDPTVVLVLGN